MKSLDQILITDQLLSRTRKEPDYHSELELMHRIGLALLESPEKIISELVEGTRVICKADSAGLSLLESEGKSQVFRWVAVAGNYEMYRGGSTPRNSSPCGVCLDQNQPVLYSRPQRYFTSIRAICPPPVEVLIIPIFVKNKALGTIWIVATSKHRHFDAEDVRVMQNIAGFLGIAIEVKRAEEDLKDKEQFNRTIMEASPDCIKVLDREDRLRYLNRNGCHLLGISNFEPFLGTKWVSFWKGKCKALARKALKQARESGLATFEGMRPTLSGVPKWWAVTLLPLPGSQDQLLIVSRDITSAKKYEETLKELNLDLEHRVALRTQELKLANNRLRLTNQTLARVEEEEKKHLAKELHDELGQHLTALKLTLENLEAEFPLPRKIHVTRAQTLHRRISLQLRKLSFDLRQNFKEGMSLTKLLKKHFEMLKKENGIHVVWKKNTDTIIAPAEISRATVRIIQEALTNIAKHAGVTRAYVTTNLKPKEVYIEVRDKGCGFAPVDRVERCSGISGMKERVDILGGSYELQTAPGKGTVVRVRLPVLQEEVLGIPPKC